MLTDTDDLANTEPQIKKKEQWKGKVLHGQHPHDLQKTHIDMIAKIDNLFSVIQGSGHQHKKLEEMHH